MSAFICFILPLLLIALGAALGYQAGMTIYTAAAGGILGLLLGAAAVKKYDSCLGKRIDTKATITAIIQPDEEEAETAEALATLALKDTEEEVPPDLNV